MKTAVEWLIEQLTEVDYNCINKTFLQNDNSLAGYKMRELFEKSKEMEKEQIMDAYEQGYRDGETNSNTMNYGIDISKFADAKIYYNQTFKSE
jgi:hypothetical protein